MDFGQGKLDFRRVKSRYFPRDSLVSGNFGDSFSYAIFYHVCTHIYFVELKYSQLKINHLNNTPSTKAVGGGIYSGVFNKDVKVPVKVTRRSSLVPLLSTINHISIWHVCLPVIFVTCLTFFLSFPSLA